jgi:type IV pilus assembly protein PilA
MKQKGFTLIELMIVVSIIGILVTIAVFPIYQDYTGRARVTEGLEMASAAKLAVAETTMSNGSFPADQAAAGYITPAATTNVSSVSIGANGIITVTYTAVVEGGNIILTPTLTSNGDITWDCTGGSLKLKYRPSSCR